MVKRTLLIGAGALAVVALGASPAQAATGKPDGRIKLQDGEYVGNKVFTPPSPIDDQTEATGDDATFVVRVKNRGTQRDTITVDAAGALLLGGSRQILYKGDDVTAEALAGDLKLKRVPAGASSKPITIIHDVSASIGSTAVTHLDMTSKNNSSKVDAVRAATVQGV